MPFRTVSRPAPPLSIISPKNRPPMPVHFTCLTSERTSEILAFCVRGKSRMLQHSAVVYLLRDINVIACEKTKTKFFLPSFPVCLKYLQSSKQKRVTRTSMCSDKWCDVLHSPDIHPNKIASKLSRTPIQNSIRRSYHTLADRFDMFTDCSIVLCQIQHRTLTFLIKTKKKKNFVIDLVVVSHCYQLQ